MVLRDGGGLEGICGGFGQKELERIVGLLDGLVFQTLQPAVKRRDLPPHTHTHSKPHVSFNMHADGQAVTQTAPIRASSG